MLRIIALVATVAAVGSLAGTASAHPPDLYDSTYGTTTYGTLDYGTSTYGGGYSSSYPSYGTTYGTSAYVAPTYSGTASYGSTYAPAYDSTPIYTKTYSAPPTSSYSGYTSPSYGYRHKRRAHRAAVPVQGVHGYPYARNAYYDRPLPRDRHRSFGPYSAVPSTEGLNVGFAGGPTFGTDENPVINGVSLNGAPN